jgi:hypothetical protein
MCTMLRVYWVGIHSDACIRQVVYVCSWYVCVCLCVETDLKIIARFITIYSDSDSDFETETAANDQLTFIALYSNAFRIEWLSEPG